MADFSAVLRKTIESLQENTPEARERIYQRARGTIEAKLKAITPPPSAAIVERQRSLLENSISVVEAEYAPPPPVEAKPDETESELENVLKDLESLISRPAKKVEPIVVEAPQPVVADELPSTSALAKPEITPAAPVSVAHVIIPDIRTPDEPKSEVSNKAISSEHPVDGNIPQPTDEEIKAAANPYMDLDGAHEPDEAAKEKLGLEEEVEVAAEVQAESAVSKPVATRPTSSDKDISGDFDALFSETTTPEQTEELSSSAKKSKPDSQSSADPVLDLSDRPAVKALRDKQASKGRNRNRMFFILLLLLLVGALAAAGWYYRHTLMQLTTWGQTEVSPPADDSNADSNRQNSSETGSGSGTQQIVKLTQRLLPDGTEVDEGPASDGSAGIGEGTSVASSVPGTEDAASAQTPELTVQGQQKSIFYEERTLQEPASASNGSVVWSLDQESPGDGLPAEPVIYGTVNIPDRDLRLSLSIRRNIDDSLPASYIMELIFLTSDNFAGGAIANVASVSLKRTEQDAGNRLMGVPAKISDGFFLVGLSDQAQDMENNDLLLERMTWMDIPIVYTSGRRALITMDKGSTGAQIFSQAIAAWRLAREQAAQ